MSANTSRLERAMELHRIKSGTSLNRRTSIASSHGATNSNNKDFRTSRRNMSIASGSTAYTMSSVPELEHDHISYMQNNDYRLSSVSHSSSLTDSDSMLGRTSANIAPAPRRLYEKATPLLANRSTSPDMTLTSVSDLHTPNLSIEELYKHYQYNDFCFGGEENASGSETEENLSYAALSQQAATSATASCLPLSMAALNINLDNIIRNAVVQSIDDHPLGDSNSMAAGMPWATASTTKTRNLTDQLQVAPGLIDSTEVITTMSTVEVQSVDSKSIKSTSQQRTKKLALGVKKVVKKFTGDA